MIRTLAAAALLAFAFTAQADDDAKARAAIKSLVPNASIDSIAESALPGFYEVVMSGQVLYVSKDGKYLMQGMLFDVAARKDLTESVRAGMRANLLKEIGPERRIVFAPKDPRYTVTVFTDIDCGYCRQLHAHMDEFNAKGIAIEYLFFPRSGPGTDSWKKAVSVWCSDDQRQAMTNAKSLRPIDHKECDNALDEDFEIAGRMGVSFTPSVIAADGSQLGGYLTPDQLLTRLQQASVQQARAK